MVGRGTGDRGGADEKLGSFQKLLALIALGEYIMPV